MSVAGRSRDTTTMTAKLPQDYTHTDDLTWQPFPEAFSGGGVTCNARHDRTYFVEGGPERPDDPQLSV